MERRSPWRLVSWLAPTSVTCCRQRSTAKSSLLPCAGDCNHLAMSALPILGLYRGKVPQQLFRIQKKLPVKLRDIAAKPIVTYDVRTENGVRARWPVHALAQFFRADCEAVVRG